MTIVAMEDHRPSVRELHVAAVSRLLELAINSGEPTSTQALAEEIVNTVMLVKRTRSANWRAVVRNKPLVRVRLACGRGS